MARQRPAFTPQPRRMCDGKNCYERKHEAEQVKTEQEIIHPDLTLKVYRCHMCGTWHLTRSTE